MIETDIFHVCAIHLRLLQKMVSLAHTMIANVGETLARLLLTTSNL